MGGVLARPRPASPVELAAAITLVLSRHSEGFLEGAFVATRLFDLSVKFTEREEDLVQPVGGAF